MRILMLAQFYPPAIGGEERHVRNLSIELAARGHDVSLATLWHKGEADFEKNNPDLRDKIDRAMDTFIKPIMAYASKHPDPTQVQAAYNDYLDKLKQGDQ